MLQYNGLREADIGLLKFFVGSGLHFAERRGLVCFKRRKVRRKTRVINIDVKQITASLAHFLFAANIDTACDVVTSESRRQ